MGDQFRSDSSKETTTAPVHDDEDVRAEKRARQDEAFDGSHAPQMKLAHSKTVTEPQGYVSRSVEGQNGTDAQLANRFSEALMRSDRAAAMAAVMDMSSKQREALADADVLAIAAIGTPRDVMIITDFARTNASTALRAILSAQPRISTHELRGYLADGAYAHDQLDAETVTALRGFVDAKKGSPLDLFSELDDLLASKPLLEWYLAVTTSKDVARDMLAASDIPVVHERVKRLTAYGPAAWAWLETLDSSMAHRAPPDVLRAYETGFDAKRGNAPPAALTTAITESDQHAAEGKAAKDKEHRAIAAQRTMIVTTKSAPEIVEAARGAGLDFDGQLAWLLDKPGLTATDLHRATASMLARTGADSVSDATVMRLIARFPTTSVTELFGDVPSDIADSGAANLKIARWLLHGAAPETILRIVSISPNNVAGWCEHLKKLGVGYGWLHQLGGRSNDQFLRRFALQCPDPEPVKYVEERLLGTGAYDTTETAKGTAIDTTAYAPAAAHLDTSLKTAMRTEPQTAEQRAVKSEAIAGDLVDLTKPELDALARDPAKLDQVLATADKATFVRILDLVHVDLSLAMRHADASKIAVPHLLAWSQTRPATEVAAFLRDEDLVDTYVSLVDHGLLDCFPTAATVLAPTLGRRQIVKWLMKCTPTTVLRALATSTATLDAAVRAFAPIASKLEDWLPPAAALDVVGRGALHQLASRSHGALRSVLDRKLVAKMPDEDAEGDAQTTAANAASIRDATTKPAIDEAITIVERFGDASTLRAFFRTHVFSWVNVQSDKLSRIAAVFPDVAPDVATGRPLNEFLANAAAWPWAIATVAPHRILDAMDNATYPVAASLLVDIARDFFLNLPRGRLLTAAYKAKLHAIAREGAVSEHMKGKLFEVAFDVPLTSPKGTEEPTLRFDGAEIEKIWSAVEKVPHAHVDERSIRNFISVPQIPGNGTAGTYDPTNRRISINKNSTTEKKNVYDNATEMTEDQAVAAAGSRADFDKLVADKRLAKNANGSYLFSQVKVDEFSATVLHEVGHSVDAMLGGKTELVYGLAGWKRFGLDLFEHWAADLGGWDTVSPTDQKDIARVWKSWLAGGGKGAVADLVPTHHAAVRTEYAAVGVVALARSTGLPQGVVAPNGLRALVRTQEFYTLSQRGHDASPTAYALTAPEEYFAECYATYYGKFVETGGKSPKGELVVPWIKTWMDKHIDTVRHNPMSDRFPRARS